MFQKFIAVNAAKVVASKSSTPAERKRAQRVLDKQVGTALATGWAPESFPRQIAQHPKIYVAASRKPLLNTVAKLSRSR